TANWDEEESFKFTYTNGETTTDRVIPMPEDAESFRTIVRFNDPEKPNAAIDYDLRPTVRLLHTSETLQAAIEEGFEGSYTPDLALWNRANLVAYRADTDEQIVDIAMDAQDGYPKDGYDSLRGYTSDTSIYPYKSGAVSDIDYENSEFTLKYTAKVEIRTVLNSKSIFDQAIADERIDTVRHGYWYDLLPKGVNPDISSIKLRKNDTLIDAYVIRNYKDSGRNLLVVEAELTPTAERYRAGDMYYFMDVPTITFNAKYSFVSYEDYGELIHNVVAFEADENESLGTIHDYTAEPDDPYSTNNISTPNAFIDTDEKDLMKDLDRNHDKPVFVYAGVNTTLDKVNAGRSSLQKEVDVNNEKNYTSGVYYGNKENARDVSIGGTYTYRLRMSSDDETTTKNIIIYDALETFKPTEKNDVVDAGAPTWQGHFRSVDVSQLVDLGCDPVVYFSIINDLQLSVETDPISAYTINTDLENGEVWVKADEYDESMGEVHAIAIDASKAMDGGEFVLEPGQSIVAFVEMEAPSMEEVLEQGLVDNDAHAYNNAYLLCTTIKGDSVYPEDFVRKDYTKVGLLYRDITVYKEWDDDNNRDGVRPESVRFTLYQNGEARDEVLLPKVAEDGTLIWEHTFKSLPYYDYEGDLIRYNVEEEAVPDYSTVKDKLSTDEYQFTNIHEPERTTVYGRKIWEGDSAEDRPDYLTIK
ncbi:MAG: Cna B-type domain-containing protein, partial [Erysipelotrichaceae bacterium]|nr:Cna B-type domain-containing protein [Erysipelotrichaceae bacterium]